MHEKVDIAQEYNKKESQDDLKKWVWVLLIEYLGIAAKSLMTITSWNLSATPRSETPCLHFTGK